MTAGSHLACGHTFKPTAHAREAGLQKMSMFHKDHAVELEHVKCNRNQRNERIKYEHQNNEKLKSFLFSVTENYATETN